MKNNRRDFLKLTGMTGLGFAGAGIAPAYANILNDGHKPGTPPLDHIRQQAMKKHTGKFNMNGYAAPKLDTVRIGIIGIGSRGSAAVMRLNHIGGIAIKALGDLIPEHAESAKKQLEPFGVSPDIYSGKEDAWKQVCEREDIDLIYTCTPWALHTPIALYAMEHGKHIATEVPAAMTIEDCWKLVETSERTRKHCMMLENCCYDFFELMTLNMARQGFFGDIIHGEGAYIHYRTENVFHGKPVWRLKENMNRNGNLYPTHGFGPICQVMNINRGDKLEYMSSMSSNDFTMSPIINHLAQTNDDWKPYANKSFRGNMNTSIIRTHLGRTIMLQHDVSSPRVYSRIHLISGTKGSALKYPLPGKIQSGTEEWLSADELRKLEEKYNPEIIRKIGEMAAQIGGHGGMDLLMDWRMIDCLRNGLPLDMNVYDAAAYSCIEPLSEWSVANRSNSINIPDFTNGAWKTNKPVMDINFERGGGSTKIAVYNESK